jgi:hypothetical protein
VSDNSAGTGRLFRSLRAEGAAADTALPALTLDEAVGLRSVTLGSSTPAPVTSAAPVLTSPPPMAPAAASDLEYAEVAPRPETPKSDEATPESAASDRETPAHSRGAHAAPGVSSAGVWLIVIGVTVVMGFADALVVGRSQLGWLTGISLLAASIYGALVVRREDEIVAVIAPPLAFFLATVTAGQLTLPPSGSLLIREAFMIITTLGANALWIFGATLVSLAIVLVRRRRRGVATTPSQQP